MVNRALERAGRSERVDHRSHAERGLDEYPTIHEGVSARKMEKAGFVSERCETNRLIRADNALIRTLKATVKKLAEAIVLTLADFASALEQLRQKIIILHYNLRHVRKRRRDAEGYLSKAKPMYRDYGELCAKIKEKEQQRHHLEEQIKALPALSVFKRSDLKVKIAELTEDIDALKYERDQIKRGFGKETENDMAAVSQQLAGIEANIGKMDKLEARYTGDMAKSKQEFDRLKKQAAVFDLYELTDARLVLRPTMEGEAQERISSVSSDGKISIRSFWMSVSETDKLLYESGMAAWHKEQTRMRQIEQEREQQETKRKIRKHEQGR